MGMVHPSRKGSVDQVCLGMQNMTQREKRHVPVLMYLRCIQKWLQQSMSIDRQGVMDQTCLYSWIAISIILNVGIVLTYVHIFSYVFSVKHGLSTCWNIQDGSSLQVIEETHGAWKKLRDGSTDKGKLWIGK